MVAPRKYPDELRERAVRMVLDAKQDPLTRVGGDARPDTALAEQSSVLVEVVATVGVELAGLALGPSSQASDGRYGVE
jgi:hypothetical protein